MSLLRKELLVNEEIYHVFNKTVASEEIFIGKRELLRGINLLNYYHFSQKLSYSHFRTLPIDAKKQYISVLKNNKPLVIIYAYALMPNHFHLLVKQKMDNGIRIFLSNLQNSFAKYFNTKHDRKGSLFLKPFKTKRITSEEALLHVSRYIHLNPITAYLVEYNNHETYPWTSYLNYLGDQTDNFINSEFIINIVGSRNAYEKFVANQSDYQRRLHKIKNFLID